MDAAELKELLALSIRAAQTPAGILLDYFVDGAFSVERKGDGSPVSIADREAETAIRGVLQGDSVAADFDVLGEEFGEKGSKTRYRWLIDPIDGTRSFVSRIPLFGTIVALEDRETGKALIGVIHLPTLDRTYSAARGFGSFCNGRAVSVSRETDLETSIVATGDIAQFISAGCEGMFRVLADACPYLRSYTDCFGHTLVIDGSVGAMVDPALNPWDAAATQVLVEEAGGTVITRPSRVEHKIDTLFGTPELVEQLGTLLHF
jgi:histidinol phosphatase-like enzyme (inositol monophosphatase family)